MNTQCYSRNQISYTPFSNKTSSKGKIENTISHSSQSKHAFDRKSQQSAGQFLTREQMNRKVKKNTRYTNKTRLTEDDKESQMKFQEMRSHSADFRPTFEPRRTFGNIKYLLEVVHKKVRAKSIECLFEQSNYTLDFYQRTNKGLKGSKLTEYSHFNGPLKQKHFKAKFQNNLQSKMGEQQEKDTKNEENKFTRHINVLDLNSSETYLQQTNKQDPKAEKAPAKEQCYKNYNSISICRKKGKKIHEDKTLKQIQKDIQVIAVKTNSISSIYP